MTAAVVRAVVVKMTTEIIGLKIFFQTCLHYQVWTSLPCLFLSLFHMSFVLVSTICVVSWILIWIPVHPLTLPPSPPPIIVKLGNYVNVLKQLARPHISCLEKHLEKEII